jgi:hypothetical protein
LPLLMLPLLRVHAYVRWRAAAAAVVGIVLETSDGLMRDDE